MAQRLWQGVCAQFMVDTLDGRPLGLVACYAADFRNQHAKIALVGSDLTALQQAYFIEGFELFIGYLFEAFPFRRLYGEVLGCNLGQFERMVGRYCVIEACFKEHDYCKGEWIDSYVLTMTRAGWLERPSLAERASRPFPVEDRQLMATDFSSFATALASLLDHNAVSSSPDTRLREDLELDSLGYLELVDLIETAGGRVLPDDAVESLVTLGDAFHFYAAFVGPTV